MDKHFIVRKNKPACQGSVFCFFDNWNEIFSNPTNKGGRIMLMRTGVLAKGACAKEFRKAFERFRGSSGIGVAIFCNGCGERHFRFNEFIIEKEAVMALDGNIKIALSAISNFQITGNDAEL